MVESSNTLRSGANRSTTMNRDFPLRYAEIIADPFWSTTYMLFRNHGDLEGLRHAISTDFTQWGIICTLFIVASLAAILLPGTDFWDENQYNSEAQALYIFFMMGSIASNLMAIISTVSSNVSLNTIPLKFVPLYLTHRFGKQTWRMHYFIWVKTGILLLLSGTISGCYLFHGWNAFIIASLIGVSGILLSWQMFFKVLSTTKSISEDYDIEGLNALLRIESDVTLDGCDTERSSQRLPATDLFLSESVAVAISPSPLPDQTSLDLI